MSFILTIDSARWRDHLGRVCDALSRTAGTAIVPVVKGNGYGLGQRMLIEESVRMGVESVAVGTVFEVEIGRAHV